MLETTLPRCLQLSIFLFMLSKLQGEVTAPKNMQALVGLPFTLGCNVTLNEGDTLKQVQWIDNHEKILLTYQPGKAVSFEDSKRVYQTISDTSNTAITLRKVGREDEGCFKCVFDIYPSGSQKGQTCLTVTADVILEGNKTAVSGKLVTLSCRYDLPMNVTQVLWTKTAEQGDTRSVAFVNKHGDLQVLDPLVGRGTLSRGMGETHLSIKPVRTEDEGCYTCEFHTFPEGTKSATACLIVYVLPQPQLNYRTQSSDVIEANCTAVARPAPVILWNVDGDNRTLGPAVSSEFELSDGTSLVISTLLFQASLLEEQSVMCIVYHHGLDSPISISINSKIGKALTILISVTTMAVLLILCLCICLWKCFLRKDY
ncbi:OX-2 membrane glycoprotein-like [Scleropages formosus]|uniref:Zgc:172122 n=1 Tax=Scleropages formosus TaxID=113540 RepID=A0A8C9RS88_SCLFO|nr:OX-2 membrane glycoprotein-like [Scleropages formosus]XP_018584118.1 OX-2 membrane glycoprotein-like [Scleropages formosus]XP_018584119.1 OX-2 membrane glycoprotein-like [Scleropages formosus]XP_018584120.1 OX-2 membrane glycoprotein-like [Scleropages formosus]